MSETETPPDPSFETGWLRLFWPRSHLQSPCPTALPACRTSSGRSRLASCAIRQCYLVELFAKMSAFGQKRTSHIQMNDLFLIKQTLTRMSEQLRVGGFKDWATALDRANVGLDQEPESKLSELRGMFGGAGSLNDLVLQDGRTMMSKENEDFDSLRSQLFSLLQA